MTVVRAKPKPRKDEEMSVPQLAAASRLFAVLSETSRLRLLQALRGGPRTVKELVKATGLNQANVSKQSALLFAAHLLKRERESTLVRYEIADPVILSLCQLACGKMAKDSKRAAAAFYPEI